MEAAVRQLIKTAIIKAGNGPAAFAATAQHCPAAGLVRLLCISPQPPQAGSPHSQMVLPAGLASAPARPWLSVAAVLGRLTVSRARSSSIYAVITVCQAPCHPFTARYSAGCFSLAFPSCLSSLRPPHPPLLRPAREPPSPALAPWTGLSPQASSPPPVASGTLSTPARFVLSPNTPELARALD